MCLIASRALQGVSDSKERDKQDMQVHRTLPLLALGAVMAVAQTSTAPESAAVDPLSEGMFSCWSSGTGAKYMKVCVSKHGNITKFETQSNDVPPQKKEHIRVGNVIEGYTVCHFPPDGAGEPNVYQDFGSVEGGWREPYKVEQPNGKNTLPLTIFRKSTDGRVELVQRFTRNPDEKEFAITMTAFNRSGKKTDDMTIIRHVNFKVNGTANNDRFLTSTHKSGLAFEGDGAATRGTGPVLSVTNTSGGRFNFTIAEEKIKWQQLFDGACGIPIAWTGEPPSGPGDYVLVLGEDALGGPLNPNGSVTAKYVYRVE